MYKVKLLLTSKPFLHLPDYGPNAGQFELQTDASGRGIGAAILQYPRRDKQPGDKPRVVDITKPTKPHFGCLG